MKLSLEQKQEFINANKAEFFTSPKTSTQEYQDKFNTLDVEEQYKVILRWKKYNEKKNNDVQTTKRVSTRSSSLNRIDMLMQGIEVELTNEEALELQEKFNVAIKTCETIIENNKLRMKEELERQLAEIQEKLAQFK